MAKLDLKKPICVIVGVGPGNGAALAERFAKDGYQLALIARKMDFIETIARKLLDAKSYICDAANDKPIQETCTKIQDELGPIDVLVYNAGSGTWGTIENISLESFEQSWRVNTAGLFAFVQQLIPNWLKKQQGSIIIIGATASLRGIPNTTAFAPAKAAQRSLAECLAKHLWPKGIHVAIIIIDGVVDLPTTREKMTDKSDDYFVKPNDVAETALWLTKQPKSSWSFQVEARPFGEKW